MPQRHLFLTLPLLALLLFFTPRAQAQSVVGGPNLNFGTATAGTPWSTTIYFAGSCNGQYSNGFGGGSYPPGISPTGTQAGSVVTFSGTLTTPGTYTWSDYLFVPLYACGNYTYNYNLTLTVQPPLTITTTTLPGTPAVTVYSTTLSSTAGTPDYTFSLSSDPLHT
jgi:hypothetical protein